MTASTAIAKAVQALTALTILASAPVGLAAVINFDSISGPVALTNQFAAQGVMFSQIEATSQFATSVVAISAPNYATPFYSNANPGSLWFVDPVNNLPAYTGSITLTLNGYNNVGGWFDGATIDALDFSDAIIAGQSVTVSPTTGVNYGPTSISFTGQIHTLRFTNIQNSNGNLGIMPFDNLTFGALTDAPEPSSWMLVGATLLLVGSWRGHSCLQRRDSELLMSPGNSA